MAIKSNSEIQGVQHPAGDVYEEKDEKYLDTDNVQILGGDDVEITPADATIDALTEKVKHGETLDPEMRAKIAAYYGRKAEEDHLAPAQDITMILEKIIEMPEEMAMDILVKAIDYHSIDPNFPSASMAKIRQLVQGYKAADMEQSDWSFDLRTEAAMHYYHSPYPEVRSVTSPFDDPDTPCETPRAYFLGLCFMAGATGLNTFFSPRQPAIGIGANVLQLLLAPCGLAAAKILPAWGFKAFGRNFNLNPGPWTYKEQMLSTIIFTIANGAGSTYYVYLVQKLPQYLGQTWVSFGYEIMLALSVQTFGFGFAGMLRRFVIYPVTAIWPQVLPTLALNRALIVPERKGEVVNGWKLTRYQFFMSAFGLMFVYFWIPNSFFQALHSFNWMTWIAPNNFNLGMITGFYGGMGYNPWATFDWNVSGSGSLVTPFFSMLQQYGARVISGLIIIGMYWGNYAWAAYTPINSNESFDNTGNIYNITKIMGDDGYVDIDKYKQYGPPYFSGANVFGQGAWFAWYPLTLSYMTITQWRPICFAANNLWKTIRYRQSIYEGNDDAHTRMIRKYKEVPEWWFMCILVTAFGIGVAAITAYPTHTPWWALLCVVVINFIFLIPSAIMAAAANVTMSIGLFFQMLSGVVFAGNPEANMIANAFASSFNSQTDNFISDLKMAHYAKLPPRAMFRAQLLSVCINCFIFIGILNWMVTSFDNGTLCTWDNPQHFVCTDAVLVFATAVEYGAFGIRNMFTLYPIMPWCFLMGAVTGIGWGFTQKYGPSVRDWCYKRWSEERYAFWDKWFFHPASYMRWINPAVTWAGALNWTGGNNLSYATNAMYISCIFMFYIKRRYGPWWEKYNYLLEAGFDVGVAISGTIQTLVFAFSGKSFPAWWGNTVSQAGVDFQSYNQNSTLLPIPEVGYFGIPPDQYPLKF